MHCYAQRRHCLCAVDAAGANVLIIRCSSDLQCCCYYSSSACAGTLPLLSVQCTHVRARIIFLLTVRPWPSAVAQLLFELLFRSFVWQWCPGSPAAKQMHVIYYVQLHMQESSCILRILKVGHMYAVTSVTGTGTVTKPRHKGLAVSTSHIALHVGKYLSAWDLLWF